MTLPAQKKIWDHFQNEGQDSFAAAHYRLRYLLRQATKHVAASQAAILNIGVGNGWLERAAQQQGWRVAALDPSEGAIAKLAQQGIAGKVGSLDAVPFADSSFDVIFCSEVLEHLSREELPQGLRELARVLKPSGLLIGTVPFNENLAEQQVVCPDCGALFHRWGHQQSFTPASLADQLSPFFQVRKVTVIYFLAWQALNWKGKPTALIKKLLSLLGVHGKHENIYFAAARK